MSTPSSHVSAGDADSAAEVAKIDVVRGTPTEEEVAALIAAVSDAYMHETSEAVAEEPHVSAWRQTQRGLRRPLRRDIPWGRYFG
ncbi:hypothetical protein FM104_08555 [Microbacterium esteraromaticum]|uniref:Acyl-CoA carboxylase subunit epsilon n=1 Tax=Microbacterium esteraromaticum TaxID=57043 RepID=A0A1R4JRK2_9MICO|nr:acyl-CoA carboxylase subunit epsilon [Microbacterium esteraromaticum]SJN34700.1 hypothetical protein FM104_08555 [Microbacterium esteraromaticum]